MRLRLARLRARGSEFVFGSRFRGFFLFKSAYSVLWRSAYFQAGSLAEVRRYRSILAVSSPMQAVRPQLQSLLEALVTRSPMEDARPQLQSLLEALVTRSPMEDARPQLRQLLDAELLRRKGVSLRYSLRLLGRVTDEID